jgi:uncharacterized protein YxeA
MNFQKIVLSVAICLLIVILILTALIAYRAKETDQFPPVIAQCPDYWKAEDNNTCTNIHSLGKKDCSNNMDFTTADYSGSDGLKKKCEWAKGCDLTWDGITNSETNCN